MLWRGVAWRGVAWRGVVWVGLGATNMETRWSSTHLNKVFVGAGSQVLLLQPIHPRAEQFLHIKQPIAHRPSASLTSATRLASPRSPRASH